MLQTKVVQDWIFYEKFSECIPLSPPGVELGSSKDFHFWNIIMYWNGKEDSLKGWMLMQKIPMISKHALNKNCSELNFVQKTQWTHISIFPRSGARGW